MRKIVNFCDFFVICSVSTDRRIRGIAEAIEESLKHSGLKSVRAEGVQSKNWVLMDAGGVVAHLFEAQTREFYGLEYLWRDAPRVNWQGLRP